MHYLISLIVIVGVLLVLPVVMGLRTRRLRFVLPVAVLATAGALFWGWSSIGEHEVLDSVSVVGPSEIQVAYSGGDCEDQRSVSVDEGEHAVKVAITTRTFASGCSDVAVLRKVTVKLDSPLGSRAVVDAHCSAHARSCERGLTSAE